MFTGIIETVAHVTKLIPHAGDLRLEITLPKLPEPAIKVGDSMAINGACMTVVNINNKTLAFDVSTESLRCTNLGELQIDSQVNIEFAMLPTTRFGGHIVSGHIDDLAKISEITPIGECWEIKFIVPNNLKKYIAAKGSICLDGVSLTVNTIENNIFSVNIIPHTWQHTIVQFYQPGTAVNLEVDLVARYLERLKYSN